MSRLFRKLGGLFCAVAFAAGCSAQSTPPPAVERTAAITPSLAAVFPGANVIPGWTPTDQAKTFGHENLFSLVDGQADGFFVYGFEQVAAQKYTDSAGTILNIEIWQLATPADAYGLFTQSVSGAPAQIGNDGDAEPGRRLSFWQNRYTVHVSALAQLDNATLWNFAKAISSTLPQGGERPALVKRLPQTGLKERGYVFFHEEISIQDQVWLGGTNILGLSHATNGIVARYDLSGQAARLVLIQYPNPANAAAGINALKASPVKDLMACNSRDNMVSAVFGEVSSEAASKLASEALQ
jgi:hypothetical protein